MARTSRCFILTLSFLIFNIHHSYSKKNHSQYLNEKEFTFSKHTINDTIPSDLSFFVSNRGSDTNDGRSPTTPKLSISSIKALMTGSPAAGNGISLKLEENSIFKEQYDPLQNDVHVSSFSLEKPKGLARITGMDVIKAWNAVPSRNNVFQHLLNHSGGLNNPAYNYIMIAEIDTAMEKTHPITAVKYLTLVSDIEKCNVIAGSYYTPDLTTNPVTIYIHPTQGSPLNNKFRYEVTTRNYNINGYSIDNAIYENLYLQTSSDGYGMLSAGKNSLIKNVVFQGGGTHHTVIKSGHIDSCLFLPGPKGLKERIAAVFYSAEGKEDNKITNTIFLDVPNPVYTHTDGQINHKSLLLDKVYSFGDSTDATNGLSAHDTDSIEVTNCYVEGYPIGWYGGGNSINIKNSIFRNTNQSAILLFSKSNVNGNFHVSNSLIKTNGNDQNQVFENGRTASGVQVSVFNAKVEVSNTIFHCYSTFHGPYQTVRAFQVVGTLKAHHNIYICDVNDENSLQMNYADNTSGRGTSTNVSSDYNVFILLRGSRFNWTVTPNNNYESNVYTLPEWQSLTGQDKNSIFIDLRNNPLGLKAIFVDPENGNWTFTQSPQADAIRNISAGMTTPPLFYPKRPAVEGQARPFKTPRGVSSFTGQIKSESESVVQWQTFNESDFSSFAVEYSLDGIRYMEAGSVTPVNDEKSNGYQYVHSHTETDSIFYRLRCLNTDSTSSLSSVIKLKIIYPEGIKRKLYPNPFKNTITVEHPSRNLGNINVYDFSGRLIKSFTVRARSSKTLVSLASLPSGHFVVQWISNKESQTWKIVK